MQSLLKYLLLPAMTLLPLAGQATFDFSTPVQTAATETPGKWYVDRFPPHGFVSPVAAPDGSPNALKESIAASDHQTYPDNSFYNTQGRKFDMPANTLSVTIKLYVPAAWASANGRKAGFWETVFDSGNVVGDYPIIEFQGPITSDLQGPGYDPNGGVAGFYGWNNVTGVFDFIGLPAGFTYNSWVQLTITLVPGSNFVYTVSSTDSSVSINSPLSDLSDAYVGNTILQGYNYGQDYDIFWGGGSISSLPGYGQYRLLLYWFFAS